MTNFEKPNSPDDNGGETSPEEIADIERRVAFCAEIDRLVANTPANPETGKSEVWYVVFGMEFCISSQEDENVGTVRQAELHYPPGVTTSDSGEIRRMKHVVVYTSDTTMAAPATPMHITAMSDIYKPGAEGDWELEASREHGAQAYDDTRHEFLMRLLRSLDPEQGMFLDLE